MIQKGQLLELIPNRIMNRMIMFDSIKNKMGYAEIKHVFDNHLNKNIQT